MIDTELKDLIRKAYKAGRRNALKQDEANLNDFINKHESKLKLFAIPVVSSCADVDKGHGVCKEKGCDKYATKDYNGQCDSCYDSLNYSFILKL